MYNIELSNPTGKYGEATRVIKDGAPRTYEVYLIHRSQMLRGSGVKAVHPVCRTCAEICEAIMFPPPEMVDEAGRPLTRERREGISNYFIRLRTIEVEAEHNLKKELGES